MLNPSFEQSAARTRALVAAGTIHPGALVDLASVRLRRLAEWTPGAIRDQASAAATAVLAEGKALCAELNAAR